jgi:GH35 family endo-1,4-beta-xylanase
MVTELDARIQCSPFSGCDSKPSETQLGDQANTYASIMNFCRTTENCAGVVSWGFTDSYTWIGNAAYIDFHAPLPFWETSTDGHLYDRKPAYWAMIGLIGGL